MPLEPVEGVSGCTVFAHRIVYFLAYPKFPRKIFNETSCLILTRGDRESSLGDSFFLLLLNHLEYKFFIETSSVPFRLPTRGLRKKTFSKKAVLFIFGAFQ